MDKEVDPAVLAVINEKRLLGDKRTPVEIIAKMGVFDARQKASESAWLATGDNVIVTIWGEFVSIGAGGHWFYLESLETQHRIGGGERTALQMQRAKDRLQLLKRSLDAGLSMRAVLQTNRVPSAALETDKAAKVSVRVADDQEWHVAAWDSDRKFAVLVRGPRGWVPTDDDVKAARARGGIPAEQPVDPSGQASREEVQTAAMDYLTRHFTGYGYKAEDVTGRNLGYDIEVLDKKGTALLKLAVKGTVAGRVSFHLTNEERACAKAGDPWRLALVSDAVGSAAHHKLYKASEVDQAPGLEPLLD